MRRSFAHLGEADDAFFFGQAIGLALFGRELQLGVAKHLGRHLGEHLLLRSPQDIVAHRAAHLPRLHLRRKEARRKEFEDSDEVLGAVFHGRAGQGPTPPPRQTANDLAGGAAAILDPLRFIEHDQVERNRPAVFALFDDFPVADHDFIIGDPQRHVRQPPLPGPPGLVAFDRQGRYLGRPEMKFALPVRHQRLGANHQYAADLAAAEQEADRRDRLHGFTQPHFIRQDCRMPRIEERHALELKGKRCQRHRQLAIGQQRLQWRLQEIIQAIFQLDHVLRRTDSGEIAFGAEPAACVRH